MHPAVVKAQKLATIAKEHGWGGSLSSEIVPLTNQRIDTRITGLKGRREFERFRVEWRDTTVTSIEYSIYGEVEKIDGPTLLRKIKGWPDVVEILERFPLLNRAGVVELYRRLPFDPENPNSLAILSALDGTSEIWWYSHDSGIRHEKVAVPKRKSLPFSIQNVGHRRLLVFKTPDTGLRHVMVDMILKVA